MFDNWLIWTVIAAMFFIAEIVSPTAFFFACLGLGAVFAAVTTVFQVSWLNWLVFFIVSLLSVIFSRPLANKFVKTPSRPANVDALLNQKAFVLEDIKLNKFGRVKVEGEEWLAESFEEIPKGSSVKILEIKGARLIVKKAND